MPGLGCGVGGVLKEQVQQPPGVLNLAGVCLTWCDPCNKALIQPGIGLSSVKEGFCTAALGSARTLGSGCR